MFHESSLLLAIGSFTNDNEQLMAPGYGHMGPVNTRDYIGKDSNKINLSDGRCVSPSSQSISDFLNCC